MGTITTRFAACVLFLAVCAAAASYAYVEGPAKGLGPVGVFPRFWSTRGGCFASFIDISGDLCESAFLTILGDEKVGHEIGRWLEPALGFENLREVVGHSYEGEAEDSGVIVGLGFPNEECGESLNCDTGCGVLVVE